MEKNVDICSGSFRSRISGFWAWVERSGFGVQNSGLASELWEISFLQSKKISPLTFG